MEGVSERYTGYNTEGRGDDTMGMVPNPSTVPRVILRNTPTPLCPPLPSVTPIVPTGITMSMSIPLSHRRNVYAVYPNYFISVIRFSLALSMIFHSSLVLQPRSLNLRTDLFYVIRVRVLLLSIFLSSTLLPRLVFCSELFETEVGYNIAYPDSKRV